MRVVSIVSLALITTACGKSSTQADAAPTVGTVTPAPDAAATAPDAAAPAPDAAAPAPDAAAPAPDAAAPAPDAAAPAPDAAAPAPDAAAPVPDTSPATTLVAAWVKAQNDGDFAAYRALYAPRFTGIKRAGARTRRFAREGWLADRERMFKAKMEVSADDVKVASSAHATVVTFVQSWASGTFSDRGQKQLVLVPGEGGLAIAREEMLASELGSGDNAPAALAPDDFMFALALPGGAAIELPIEDWPDTAEVGAAQLVSRTNPVTVSRAVDLAGLPATAQGWVGRKLAVYGADGSKCEGAVDHLELVARYTPHFGVVQGWNGLADGAAGAQMTDAQVAADAWSSGLMRTRLYARVPTCTADAVLFARDAGHPALTFGPSEATLPDGLADKALAATRELSGWKAIAAAAKDYPEVDAAHWDTWDGAAPAVRLWRSGQRSIVEVVAAAGSGCASFGGSFGALFELKGDALVLLTSPEGGPTEGLEGVVDLDGDGALEMLLDEGLVQKAGPIWKATRDARPPDFDCPC